MKQRDCNVLLWKLRTVFWIKIQTSFSNIINFYNTKVIIVYVRLTRILNKVYLLTYLLTDVCDTIMIMMNRDRCTIFGMTWLWISFTYCIILKIYNYQMWRQQSSNFTIRESYSGNVTIRESYFPESDYPGIVFPGNVSSGKKHPGKWLSGKFSIRETTVYPFPLSLSHPLPLEEGSLKLVRKYGRKLSQRGLGQSPGRKRIWCTLKLSESQWWQSFWIFWVPSFTCLKR